MKTGAINAANFAKSLGSDANLVFNLDKQQWLNTITAGQIIKGKVLKVYSERKYGVMLGGQERIVDSAIPLSIGNTISGKVTSIHERVVTMKIVETHVLNEAENRASAKASSDNTYVDFKMKDFGIHLTDLQKRLIVDAANKSQIPDIVINAGLYLAKLGLPITGELLHEFTQRINSKADSSLTDLDSQIPQISYQNEEAVGQVTGEIEVVENLKRYFQGDFEKVDTFVENQEPNQLSDANNYVNKAQLILDDYSNASDAMQVKRMLSNILNINTQGTLQHSLKTFPLLIDDRLVEFEVAFFDTLSEKTPNNGMKSRSVRFSLDTNFGKVHLLAHIVNDRLNINFSTVNESFSNALMSHEHGLIDQLNGAGWLVDAINYNDGLNQDSAALSIVKHVLQQGSINIAV